MSDDDQMRALTRRLFARDAAPVEPEPQPGNHAPNEGEHPIPPDPQADMRAFTRDLFTFTD